MQEAWVRSSDWEDSLEKETAAHSSILAWEITWAEKPGRLLSVSSQESDMTERLSLFPCSKDCAEHQGYKNKLDIPLLLIR